MRVTGLVPDSAKVVVEFVTWHEARSDPTGDRPQLPAADQGAHLFLGTVELRRDLADGQGCGPVHARSIPERRPSRRPPYALGMWDVLTWHDGTLAIAWWAVIVLIIALLSIGGAAAARRN